MKVTKLTSCMNLRMIQVVIKSRIKCFKRSTVERIEEKSNDVSLFVYTTCSFHGKVKFMWKMFFYVISEVLIVEG